MIEMKMNAKIINDIINLATVFADDVLFDCQKNQIEIKMFTADMAVMIHILVDANSFNVYKTDNDKFYIDTKKIKSLLNIIGLDDSITIKKIDDSKIKMSSNKNYRNIDLIDLSICDIPSKIPSPPYNFEVKLNSKELLSAIRLAELEGDSFSFIKNGDKIQILSLNEKVGTTLKDLKIVCNADIKKSYYSIDYIKNLVKFLPDYVMLKTHSPESEDDFFPILIDFKLHNNVTHVKFMLAPRIKLSDE